MQVSPMLRREGELNPTATRGSIVFYNQHLTAGRKHYNIYAEASGGNRLQLVSDHRDFYRQTVWDSVLNSLHKLPVVSYRAQRYQSRR